MDEENKFNIKTVEDVVNRWLCTSCGACAGVCPKNCIEMEVDHYGIYVPKIEEDLCNRCRLCVKVCPGHGFDYVRHQKRIFGELPQHVALGNHKELFAGFTNMKGILKRCQSGGFVSTLLLYCLDNGIIDGAVVTRWREDSPFVPQTYIARSRSEILSAVGSKYNPVPAAEMIREILDVDGYYAFVGTSCQIQAMRKAETIYPELSEKIKLYVGLHCLGVFTYHFHDQMCYKIGQPKDEIIQFRHRSKEWKGWPCDMRMVNKDGDIFDIPADRSRLNPRPFFTDWRCKLCFDKANEFSDISCGDCRMSTMHSMVKSSGYDLKGGLSEIVVRTERGSDIVNEMISDGFFKVWDADADRMASSIGVEKKIGLDSFFKIAKYFGRGVPVYGVNFHHKDHRMGPLKTMWDAWTIFWSLMYFYLPYSLNRSKIFRGLLKRIPHGALGFAKKIGKDTTYWERSKSTPSLKVEIYRD